MKDGSLPLSAMDRRLARPSRTWRVLGVGAVVVTIAAAIIAAVVLGRTTTLRIDGQHLQFATVQQGEFQEYIPIMGTIIPLTTHHLDATEGGRVEAIFREAGNQVAQGDEILRMANTNLLLDVMYREAEFFQQSNNLRNTQLALEQNQLQMRRELLDVQRQIARQQRRSENLGRLVKVGLVTIQEHEEAVEELAYLREKGDLLLATQEQDRLFRDEQIRQLEESLRRIQANLGIVRQHMESLILRAPVAGQLTALDCAIGQSKARGERLGQIDVLHGFKVRALIDEHYITRVSCGQTGSFTYSERPFTVTVTKLYPQVINGRFEVDLAFADGQPEALRRGQTLHIRLRLGDPTAAVLLANGGFYQSTGGRWVYVVADSAAQAERREITLGRQNSQQCEVLAGLQPGERVIISSYEFFSDVDRLVFR